eukprot:GHVN01055854.1.p1 GENE.GHVN01055854.1~~GHVN01055854.1.p1  ORF type:complete len:807 (+),score=137.91 GHVN01055854.1:40-2460(+)
MSQSTIDPTQIDDTQDDDTHQSSSLAVEQDEALFKSAFRDFLQTFTLNGDGASSTRPSEAHESPEFDDDLEMAGVAPAAGSITGDGYYIQTLHRLLEADDGEELDEDGTRRLHNLLIDLTHVSLYDPYLLALIIQSPADCLVFMDECVAELLGAMNVTAHVKVSVFNHPNPCIMRDMNPSDVDCLVALRGVVIRASTVIPDMSAAVFRCNASINGNLCGWETVAHLTQGEVLEPTTCGKCSSRYSMQLYYNKCLFGDKQLIKLQETPDSIPEGETPHTVMVYAYNEMVDVARPGDAIEVVGVYKAAGLRVAPRQRTLKAVFRTYIDAIYIRRDTSARMLNPDGNDKYKMGIKRMGEEMEDNAMEKETIDPKLFSAEIVRQITDLSRDPDVYEKLTRSVAPNIWENQDIKKGLLCQLFGACRKQFYTDSGDKGRIARSEIHVLLCGDPSTAKSQLIQYVHKIAPRGVYTTGRGTSAVGLTASVSRDPETKEFVLESGAIVLSDRGICCIDEFDKMSDSAKTVLHEAMEQQTVSIAKAGIVCSLNARASILACANPINSRYDQSASVVENLNLAPSLLSRFDLIYLLLDKNDPVTDANLARHVCALYAPGSTYATVAPVQRDLFTAYVSYARSTCQPRLSNEASHELVEVYLSFRSRGGSAVGKSKSVSATPRQLEALIRLSEALARMRLDNVVRVPDIREAARLIDVATYTAIVDPTTGRIDFDQLNTGIGEAARHRRETVMGGIVSTLASEANGMNKENLVRKLEEYLAAKGHKALDRGEVETVLREVEAQGSVGKAAGGRYVCRA